MEQLAFDLFWSGHLAFGFTTKDPQSLVNKLLDAIHWGVKPRETPSGFYVASPLAVEHAAKFSFHFDSEGHIKYSINGTTDYYDLRYDNQSTVLVNVTQTQSLWAVLDLYGQAKQVQLSSICP